MKKFNLSDKIKLNVKVIKSLIIQEAHSGGNYKYLRDRRLDRIDKDVKELIKRQNDIKDKIFKEMKKPMNNKLDFIAFKAWLIDKFDDMDKLAGDKK